MFHGTWSWEPGSQELGQVCPLLSLILALCHWPALVPSPYLLSTPLHSHKSCISHELVLIRALTVITLSVQGIADHLCHLVKIWKNLLQHLSPTYILISLQIYKLKQFPVEINSYRDAVTKGGKWGQRNSKGLWVCVIKHPEVLKIKIISVK